MEPGPPSGPGGATTPGRRTGGRLAGGTVRSSDSAISSGQTSRPHYSQAANIKFSNDLLFYGNFQVSTQIYPILPFPLASVKLYLLDAWGEMSLI